MTPYDPRAAALDALAAMRWPDVSEPLAEEAEAMEALLRAMHRLGELDMKQVPSFSESAYLTGRAGRPLVPPA